MEKKASHFLISLQFHGIRFDFLITYITLCSMIVSAISENSGVFGEGSLGVYSVSNSNLISAVASVSDPPEMTLPSTFVPRLDRISAICSLQI